MFSSKTESEWTLALNLAPLLLSLAALAVVWLAS